MSADSSSLELASDILEVSPSTAIHPNRFRKILVTIQLSGINFASSAVNGIITVGLPMITDDLQLPLSLSFWPLSVFSLTTASTLLLSGAIADCIGSRSVNLAGCFINGALILGAGAARDGRELVALRAVQGIGYAMHLSSSVAIVTQLLPSGRGRNVAFSCLGLSQPLGFSFGLVLGGVLENTIGWRAGFYIFGGLTFALATTGLWAIPRSSQIKTVRGVLNGLTQKVDWVGVLLISMFMAMLSYLLAVLSTDIYKIRNVETIILLCLSVIALPSFALWVQRQVRIGKPALIPNSLWKNTSFAGMCAIIAFSLAVVNTLELFASLFFQNVQHLSALEASIRIVPSLVVGVALNVVMGLFVHKMPALWIVIISSALCAGSPLLMAVIDPQSSYWANAFVAQLLQPLSTDAVFTVALIVITEVFPDDTQALAGAVFNTAAQFGGALGPAIMQVISTIVAKKQEGNPDAYMQGLRASWWAMFSFMLVCGALGALTLRRTGKVGLKHQ